PRFAAREWSSPVIETSGLVESAMVTTPPLATFTRPLVSVSGLLDALSSGPFRLTVAGALVPPVPPTFRMVPKVDAVPALSEVLFKSTKGECVELVTVAPLKTPMTSPVIVSVELVAWRKGPTSATDAGDGATVPEVADETTLNARPNVVALPANGLAPPR